MKGAPRRTCIACRQVRAKAELVRMVRDDGGGVVVDRRQVAPGRGAYVCPTPECLDRVLVPGRLARALKKPVRTVGESAAKILGILEEEVALWRDV